MSADGGGRAVPEVGAASPRLPMLAVVDRLTAIAADARADARVADADGDRERREYLMGEHRGLMEAAEVLLTFDWTAAWREACTIRTVEQLRDAAQVGVVIRDRDGNTLVFDSWFVWLEPGGSDLTPVLPAVLLWHPGWEASS